MKVGIPRALFYYYYYPLWLSFFKSLGVEVVLSPVTSKATVNEGLKLAVDEACLPIKVFYGHTAQLVEQVDWLFLPRIVSVSPKEYICPKFMGLPDMIRENFEKLPSLISPIIDRSKNPEKAYQAALEVGLHFTKNKHKIAEAWNQALVSHREYRRLAKNRLEPEEAFKVLFQGDELEQEPNGNLKVGVLGHGYTIYDPFISMQLMTRLKRMGVQPITAENLDGKLLNQYAAQLPKRMFWSLGKKILASTLYWLDNPQVDGVIFVASFGCGPDSLVGDLVERYCRRRNFPVLLLTIDEHTGEAGVATRIEAFIDMLEGKKAL